MPCHAMPLPHGHVGMTPSPPLRLPASLQLLNEHKTLGEKTGSGFYK